MKRHQVESQLEAIRSALSAARPDLTFTLPTTTRAGVCSFFGYRRDKEHVPGQELVHILYRADQFEVRGPYGATPSRHQTPTPAQAAALLWLV